MGFCNLRESNADMGFKTRWNRPLVTKLNLSKVWTQYFMGDFLILIGHVWSFKKLCFAPRALIIDQYGPKKKIKPGQGLNLDDLIILIGLVWPLKN